jgi:hypothetical protein
MTKIATHRTQRVYQKVTNTISEDGEVLESNSMEVDVLVKSDDEYAFIFSKVLQHALKLNGTEIKVLMWCLLHADYNTNLVTLTITQKKAISEATTDYGTANKKGERKVLKAGLRVASIDNAIVTLKKKDVFIPEGRCTYRIHPQLSWRGSLKERDKELKLLLRLRKQETL